MKAKLIHKREEVRKETIMMGYYEAADRTALIDILNAIELGFLCEQFNRSNYKSVIDEERLSLTMTSALGKGLFSYVFYFEITDLPDARTEKNTNFAKKLDYGEEEPY